MKSLLGIISHFCVLGVLVMVLYWFFGGAEGEEKRKAERLKVRQLVIESIHDCMERGGYFVETADGGEVCAID